MKTTKKNKKNSKDLQHKDCLKLVQQIIKEIHGVELSIPEIGKRWRDVKEGVPISDICGE